MNTLPALPRLKLQAVVCRAEENAARLRELARTADPFACDLEDHRTAVIGDLIDALNAIEPTLGDQLLAAMYPVNDAPEATAVVVPQ